MKGIWILTAAITLAGAKADDKPVTRMIENTFRNWSLEELPAPVQKTVQNQSAGHKISDIDREDRAGKTIWEVEFAGGPNGQDREIHIDNEGCLTDGDGNALPIQPKVFHRQPTPNIPKPTPLAAEKDQEVRQKWADVPQPIKEAAREFGGEPAVVDVEKEKREGLEVWELEFKRPEHNVELHFLADGQILEQLDSNPQKRAQALANPEQR